MEASMKTKSHRTFHRIGYRDAMDHKQMSECSFEDPTDWEAYMAGWRQCHEDGDRIVIDTVVVWESP